MHNDNDLFNFSISYNNPTHGGTALYNGNIAETEWMTANDNVERWYTYGYDALNRITSATGNTDKFNLTNVAYDKMGNITNLERRGAIVAMPSIATDSDFGIMDKLTYAYDSGNKLLSVTEGTNGNIDYGFKDGNTTGNDYDYDANGNLIEDKNKGITSIAYNHLNLPKSITVANGADNGTISYVYDATGVKLKKTAAGSSNSTTEYAGNYIYENNVLQFFSHPEGYVNAQENNAYVYQYKDHLGNIRLSFTDADNNGDISAETEIVEENNYYPFGLKHKGYNTNTSSLGNDVAQRWKYNGKEYDESLGLETYDFGARNYNPDLGRWMNIDPLAEQYVNWSSYTYVLNTPVNAIDPDGKRVYFIAGAGGDTSGWNYTERIGNAFTSGGIKGFQKIPNISRGKSNDRVFATAYRNKSTIWKSDHNSTNHNSYLGPKQKQVPLYSNSEVVQTAVDYIKKDLKDNPLEEGEQLNLGGISYGSVVQAHAALAIADEGTKVDNVILMSTPSAKNSELIKKLQGHKNIGAVHIINPEDDLISDTESVIDVIEGVIQNIVEGDDAPHMDQIRPGQETANKLKEIVEHLKNKKVK